MEELVIYTIEEAAQLLKVSEHTIEAEIQAGQLEAFRIGEEWRVTGRNIIDFISRGGSKPLAIQSSQELISNVGIQSSAPFHYTWPNGFTEDYPEAYEGIINEGNAQFEVKIGICERHAAGKDRKRITIFLNGRPTVEFVGTDDFIDTKNVISLITLPNKKRLKPNQTVPNEYRGFDLVRYNSMITGPRAATTMAVRTKIDDLDTMVAHAIIRANYRDRS